MEKRNRIFGIFFILLAVAFISLSSGKTIEVKSLNLTENYSVGETLKGNFNLTLLEISPSAKLTTNLGHEISIRNFLSNNSKKLDCEDYSCADRYTNTSTAFSTKSISVNSSGSKKFGILLKSNYEINLEKLELKLDLSFLGGNEVPFEIKLFDEEYLFRYVEPTNDFNRVKSYGCFDKSKGSMDSPFGDGDVVCEKISGVNYTKRVEMGADMVLQGSSGGNPSIRMTLYGEGKDNLLATCNFTASEEINSCVANTSKIIATEDLVVCAEKLIGGRNTTVKRQENQNSCGGTSKNLGNFQKEDFSVFLAASSYKGLGGQFDLVIEDLKFRSEAFIEKNYKRNCSGGCFIPFNIRGIDQTIGVKNLTAEAGVSTGTSILIRDFYEIEKTATLGSFSGVVSLDKLNWELDSVGNKKLEIYLVEGTQKTKLFEKNINISLIPLVIREIQPKTIPAGVDVIIDLDVFSTSNITKYEWSFGDGESKTTKEGVVSKKYATLGFFNLSVNVTNLNNQTAKKTFVIEAISPKNYLNDSISSKQKEIEKVINETTGLGMPFTDKLKQKLGLEEVRTELNSINSQFKVATTDEKFLELAKKLSDLKIPKKVYIKNVYNEVFASDASHIDLAAIGKIIGETLSGNKYKEYIAGWEAKNVKGSKDRYEIYYFDHLGSEKILADIYKIVIEPLSEKTYLIISPSGDIESSIGLNSEEGFKYLEIPSGQKKEISLMGGGEDRKVYVSVDPSNVDVADNIGVCNFNGVCEKGLGEDYKNCRDDCKPWPRIFLIAGIVVFLFIIIFIFIQLQFKKKYESHLFKSKQELNNLVESIKNSRKNKISYEEIIDRLIKNGWSKEQIKYAINKSKKGGEKPYEIVPDGELDKKKNEKLDKKNK